METGTARAARQEEPIAGKTGTCSEDHTHLGWFGAFNNVGRRLVVVVLLRGGRQATGARAAVSRGHIYRRLGEANYLAVASRVRPAALPGPPPAISDSVLAKALILLCASAILILVWQKLIAARTEPTGILK